MSVGTICELLYLVRAIVRDHPVKITPTILALFGSILFTSAFGQKEGKSSGYPCEQEAMLFGPDSSASVFDVKSSNRILARIDSLRALDDKKGGQKNAWEYGLRLSDQRKVPIKIQKRTAPDPALYSGTLISVSLHRSGPVVASVVGGPAFLSDSLDSLSNWFQERRKNVLFKEDKNDIRMELTLHDSVPVKRLEKTLEEIIQGYRDFYKDISGKKDLCDLSSEQVQKLSEKMPFELTIPFYEQVHDKEEVEDTLSNSDLDVDESSEFNFESGNARDDGGEDKNREKTNGSGPHILYTEEPCRVSRNHHRKDVCYLHITSHFANDTVVAKRGDSLVLKEVFNTEPSTGIAGIRSLGSMDNKAPIRLRVNKGSWATVKPHPYSNLILLQHFSKDHAQGIESIYSGVTLRFKCEIPVYK